eukprot:4215973-Prymnesium_polylepis.1
MPRAVVADRAVVRPAVDQEVQLVAKPHHTIEQVRHVTIILVVDVGDQLPSHTAVLELGNEGDGVLVELLATAILAEWHTQYEMRIAMPVRVGDRARPQLDARYPRAARSHRVPITARLEPRGCVLRSAHGATRQVVQACGERRLGVGHSPIRHPAEIT